MPDLKAIAINLPVSAAHTVSGIVQLPDRAFACVVLAHGAGAGMTHPFMAAVADGLGERDVATLRFQFPYMESGSKRPDRPQLAHATIRAAAAAGDRYAPGLPLFAGGKSFGARMTSQTQAEAPLPNVRGMVFFGFPLHPANKPSDERAQHLSSVQIPMLFLQGTRDALADMRLLAPVVERLATRATLRTIEHADHSFHVPVKSGRTDKQVLAKMLDEATAWIRTILDSF